jgi:hypothetical protein
MRLKSGLGALGIALGLVVSLDYVSYAATGDSFLLGKPNAASTTTSLTRTTNGPVLALNSQAGQPPLTVNRPVKAPNLNADLLDGLDSTRFATRSRVTAFTPPGCQSLSTVTTGFQKISDLGSFTKVAGDTMAEINFSTTLYTASSTGTGTVFELRVDNAPTTLGRATVLTRQPGEYLNAHLQGVFRGLPAGAHTVSIWAKSTLGNATQAMYDPGCFNSAGVNNVYVEEFR